MAQIKGIIFDFNGTLFWDSKLHEKAWREFAIKYTGRKLSDDDFKHWVHGRINRDIIQFIFDKTFTVDETQHYSDLKETIYRNYLNADKNLLKLAPGAVAMLNYFKTNLIPVTIATSAEISNVDYYFKTLNLAQWFDFDRIVYDDGSITPKPAPDIFLKAARKIGLTTSECLVAEDSVTGIMAAKNAGIAKIIFVENDEPIEFLKVKDYVDGKITNLLELKSFV